MDTAALRDYNLIRPRDELDDFFAVKYPYAFLLVAAIYVWFVKIYGPKFMENRKPYKLTNTIRLYNLIQVLLNGYVVFKATVVKPRLFTDMVQNYCNYFNNENVPTYIEMAGLINLIAYIKLVDLLDTVFMVLRKKHSQISFLHVYHHSIVVVIVAVGLSDREGAGMMLIFLNTFIHIKMYLYYFLSSFENLRKPLAFWKPLITKLQLIQFGIMLVILGSIWYNECPMGKRIFYVITFMVFSFIYLFSKFYVESYMTTKNNVKNKKK